MVKVANWMLCVLYYNVKKDEAAAKKIFRTKKKKKLETWKAT